ncbi:PREDICTED: bromodomain adjacent to zinc finger domain protein 1A isoform X2 [Nicrophorus vespilloides]|uniref:Bromodomain adjacent to zinc finger domain protein 1A isoform X2 n=1 Tax=Nicrophorus vespilloides TaxID=110193 RepID=A0ABM1MYN6_NICVS|nr:PREDICTED: bromodomain adjacent to zinc finger domain protein 1A isoform X2 [Nicrophorus vespilloides]
MPLLKNRTLEKAPISEFLRDNEEVFHCEMTNEIFRDYDDFAEKTILCNSMVWTCSVTGKANLTYEEALRSENSAKKMLATFPEHMKIPLLYIASLTKRSSFKDMADDIFSFVKRRYFVGEQVDAMLVKRDWQTCKVVKVIAPSKEELEAYKNSPEATSNSNNNESFLPPVLYKYKLIVVKDNATSNVSETSIVKFSNIRRKPFIYTTESNKLFLKQYIESSKGGNLVLKQSAIDFYNLNSVSFDAIFDGPGPEFKKTKKVRQETIASFLTKNKLIPKETTEITKPKLSKSEIISMYKEWSTVKDDLLLEDQKIIPKATPITSLIPENYLGDALCILEFMAEFSTILETRNYFPGGMSFKEMERALLEKKPGSPLVDILQLMINSIFVMQENEHARYRTTYKKKVDGISAINMENELSLTDSSKLANVAYRWCWRYHGAALRDFPVLNLTVSEILRLHLIMSGGVVSETCSSWRKANRGGFRSEDDPAIHFRLQNPHIIKHLSSQSVVELTIGDKIKLITCLMDQLLTYEEFRTAAENVREQVRSLKIETKNLQIAEKKQILESTDKINKLKKGGSFNPTLDKEIQELETELENFKSDTEYKIIDNNQSLIRSTTHVGYDRGFRRYIKLKSLKGLYVNSDELNAGTCLPEPTRHVPQLVNAEKDEVMKYLSKSSEEMNTSDKENEPSVKKENGCSEANVEKGSSTDELLMCSSDPATCVIHSKKDGSSWSFFTEREQLDELINSMNVRGVRESDLKEALSNGREFLAKYIKTTPLKYYEDTKPIESTKKSKSVNKNEDNFGYPDNMPIRDVMCTELVLTILEFEDKLYSGGIGGINHSMRAEWRELLEKMDFDKMDLTVHKHREYDDLVANVSDDDEGEASDQIPEVIYKDPAVYLGKNKDSIEMNGVVEEKELQTIKHLATTLMQVAYTIFPDNLRRPMGRVVTKSANKMNNVFKNLILNWSTSLLASTSFSQLYLHFYTLDDCVMWNKTVSCQICRKAKNLTQMLLCDDCNSGYHLYCLKPKLSEVPEGEWFCKNCIKQREEEERRNSEAAIRKKEALERRKKRESGKLEKEAEEVEFGFGSDSNDEEEPVNCTKCGDFEGDEILKCDECPRAYHLLCLDPPLRRMPRGKWVCNGCKELESSKQHVEGIRRSNRHEVENRSDLPLHNVALQELLVDVMKHKDAWPFTRPVQKIEVPDYYTVISKPMDFGTIKYNLNMGKYKYDAEFMADAQLVFGNCNAYNSSDAEVYKCGERLLKYFSKKCNELNLRRPSDMNINEEQDEEPVNKKRRMM